MLLEAITLRRALQLLFKKGANLFGLFRDNCWIYSSLEQSALPRKRVAEGVGFEPTEACASPVFKTGAINHSTTPPFRCWRSILSLQAG